MDVVIKFISERIFPEEKISMNTSDTENESDTDNENNPGSKSGTEFEIFVSNKLNLYPQITRRELKILGVEHNMLFSDVQPTIEIKQKIGFEDNDDVYFAKQPFNSQKDPDFIIFYRIKDGEDIFKIYTLEVKSSKNNNHPVWNGSIPFPSKHNLYLYYHHGNKRKYYWLQYGCDMITHEERNILTEFSEESKKQTDYFKKKLKGMRWGLSNRQSFEQNFECPETTPLQHLDILRSIYGEEYSLKTNRYLSKHSKENVRKRRIFYEI